MGSHGDIDNAGLTSVRPQTARPPTSSREQNGHKLPPLRALRGLQLPPLPSRTSLNAGLDADAAALSLPTAVGRHPLISSISEPVAFGGRLRDPLAGMAAFLKRGEAEAAQRRAPVSDAAVQSDPPLQSNSDTLFSVDPSKGVNTMKDADEQAARRTLLKAQAWDVTFPLSFRILALREYYRARLAHEKIQHTLYEPPAGSSSNTSLPRLSQSERVSNPAS